MKINEEELQNLLPDFLKGNMSEQEKTAFEQKIQNADNREEIERIIKV